MNELVLNAALATALSTASFSLLAANDMPPAKVPDQVVASFDRLLNHTATAVSVANHGVPKVETDPLRTSVNAVLWEHPSYHLPAQYAFYSTKPRPQE